MRTPRFPLALLAAVLAFSPRFSAALEPEVPEAAPTTPSEPAAAEAAPAPATTPDAAAEGPALPEGMADDKELGAPEGASATAAAEEPVIAEEVGEDGLLPTKAAVLMPAIESLDSETLATMATHVDKDSDEFFYDPATKQSLAEANDSAWHGPVDALYYELAQRTLNDNKDKAARQAFALALFKDAERAKAAKDLAYDDKLATTVIAQLEGGRERSKRDLEALAAKGNRKARLYLGLDKPAEPETTPVPEAEAAPEGAPAMLSPSAAPAK